MKREGMSVSVFVLVALLSLCAGMTWAGDDGMLPKAIRSSLSSPMAAPDREDFLTSLASLPPSPPDWFSEGDQEWAIFGTSVAGAGDVNGDGYADVIVGAPQHSNPEQSEGRAYVYHGGSGGLSAVPSWEDESDQADAYYGWNVACAGDVNGDGYSDIAVGAPEYGNGENNEGRVYVYHGGPLGLSSTPNWTSEGNKESAYFGCSVAGAGDVNGDGYSDVIVGAWRYDNGEASEGAAFVFHGGPSGLSANPAWAAEGNAEGVHFGCTVAGAGDVNGDGYSDVIVGAYIGDPIADGHAYVYHGSSTGLADTPAWTTHGYPGRFYELGDFIGSAGDVNGDGYSDVVLGGHLYGESKGRVSVFHGSGSGLSTSPDWDVIGDYRGQDLGYAVAGDCDINGDGYSDVLVGTPSEYRAYAYKGGPTGLEADPSWMAECDQNHSWFGACLAGAGDVNHDRACDIIVGAWFYSHGEEFEGRAFVYHGVPVPAPSIEATVDIKPETLNLESKGKFVTCYIELPDGYDPRDIDVSTVFLNGAVEALPSPSGIGDYDMDGIPDMMVKFDRSEVIALLDMTRASSSANGYGISLDRETDVDVTVSGELVDGTVFLGEDTIRVINPGGPRGGWTSQIVSTTVRSGKATISYELASQGNVSLKVYDAAGRLVRTLENRHGVPGRHTASWDLRDDQGRRVTSGVYFIMLDHKDGLRTQKLLLAK